MNIRNHFLDDISITRVLSPNMGGVFQSGLPDTIILHYTAGSTAQSAIRTLTNPANSVSSHLVVDRDGSVTQLIPFNRIAWHAGKSSHGGRIGLNSFSVGIEMVNAGRLERRGNQFFAWFGKQYPEEEVIQATHRNEKTANYWHRYTGRQIETIFQLCSFLKEYYPIKYILGHEEIAPGRKIDPGPAFPLDQLRNKILL